MGGPRSEITQLPRAEINNSPIDITRQVFEELLALVECDTVESIYIRNCRELSSEDRYRYSELIAQDVDANAAFDFFDTDQVVHLNVESARLGDEIGATIKENLPQDIRGDFHPSRPLLSFGEDWWCDADNPEVRIPHRVLVGCWGYSTPNDSEAMREATLALPRVNTVAQRMASIVGEVETALYWHF